MKSFRPKGSPDEAPGNGPGEPPPGRNGEVDFRKTSTSARRRLPQDPAVNKTHASTTNKIAP